MSRLDQPEGPTAFRAKRWIYWAQAGIVGPLAVFSLIFGPICWAGHWRTVQGRPATDAGWPLIIVGGFLLLVFAQAVAQLSHRRTALLRLCREGVEFRLIGRTSLDQVRFVPRLVWVAWSIVSTQGFRAQVVRLPWPSVGEARVVGPPLGRLLLIASRTDCSQIRSISGPGAKFYALHQAEFTDPVDRIAAAINRTADDFMGWHRLASWDQDPALVDSSFPTAPLA